MLILTLFEAAKLSLTAWWNYARSQGMTEAELDAKLVEVRKTFEQYNPVNLPPVP